MPIDRVLLEDHLTMAERHVAQGERHVARQRELVAQLERRGHDTLSAKELVVQFQELEELHIADRDRLRHELGLDAAGVAR